MESVQRKENLFTFIRNKKNRLLHFAEKPCIHSYESSIHFQFSSTTGTNFTVLQTYSHQNAYKFLKSPFRHCEA